MLGHPLCHNQAFCGLCDAQFFCCMSSSIAESWHCWSQHRAWQVLDVYVSRLITLTPPEYGAPCETLLSVPSPFVFDRSVLYYRHEKNTRHHGGGRYGNGIFHCILGVKERALFRLAQIELTGVSFRFVLLYGRKRILALLGVLSSPHVAFDFIPVYLLSSTRLLAVTLSRVFLLEVGQ
ncbi:hypothetical protein AVEN_274116-1 [Araneus ventricosus]|uniref:Uncharacterized protein n=1 Tax=Araneus ventricosus TaxID=182803 RepID=A0A4Y2LGB8_ARAVE|nr:hypothetical protein AVEN_274116-1 [Araneus ventricosus]